MNSNTNIELDYGNCEIVRFRGKEAYVKDVSLRTGTWYKADGRVKLAQHSEGLSSMSEVNHGVVHWNNVLLPGEASRRCIVWFKSTNIDDAALSAMPVFSGEESAESIVDVSEPVSSCRPLGISEECGQSMRSKARTKEEEATEGAL